jgi:hypothetical protein
VRIDFVEKYINEMSEVFEEDKDHHKNDLTEDKSSDPIVIEILSSDEEDSAKIVKRSDLEKPVIFKITRTPITESSIN